MLTKEQIKNLKPGDPILIHGIFTHLHVDGDIDYEAPYTGFGDKILTTIRTVHPSYVSLPENGIKNTEEAPKHNPCRKFRKGDMVRYCAPDGRIYADRGSLREHIKNRDLTHVVRDEQENGRVGVYDPLDEENSYYVPAHSLELVTPVEKLEPYCVRKYSTFYAVEKYNNHKDRPATYDIYFHQNAKAAAEAERDRLNEEYRKEQK